MPPILKIEKASFVYGKGTPFERCAIDEIDLEIMQGEFLGIIGHTGSGKSTLAQHLNGLLKPSSGTVRFKNDDIWSKSVSIRDIRFKVGLVFQYPEYQLFEETVFKDVAYGPLNMKLPESEIEERVYSALDFVGLDRDTASKSPFDLSGGQKRRVAIAGVVAMKPEVLILDEPTAGLDPRGCDEIFTQINDYQKSTGCTVILVSHSMENVARYVDRIVVMNKAKVFADGTPKEVFSRSEELEAVGLSPPMVTQVLLKLGKLGMGLDMSAFTVDQARDVIIKALSAAAVPKKINEKRGL